MKNGRINERNIFQFHYGSVKRVDVNSIYTAAMNFNSTMVRLKVNNYLVIYNHIFYFNSTMVRLKVAVGRINANILYISIPLWFG